MTSIPHYEQHAARLVEQYESLSFEEVHASLLDLLPPAGATVLDVGAGSGRDAAWFAAKGYDVVAVEPSHAMLAHALERHPSNRIHWLADSLPDLANVRRLSVSFDLILLSAVWMHVPAAERQRALRKLAILLAPKGRIAISLRIVHASDRADKRLTKEVHRRAGGMVMLTRSFAEAASVTAREIGKILSSA